ncbi:MAG: 2'-5' RNA ligase family protein [candidate division Zixibacteria bacterium]|nr:2'-5' RNA ligase family protein [candidate division Zixibacteria bacterium]MDD5425220.1 2'-5' RNA ligase family protein [candidate division Zixibacteria bacterium]
MNAGYRKGDLNKEDDHNRYAVVIFLPRPLDEIVAYLREQFDPDYNIIASHVTVVFPFETTRSMDDITRIINRETYKMEPFKIELSSINDFYPDYPIIYWQVKKNPIIDELYKNLYIGLDLALPFRQLIPHVTIAKEISLHRVMLVKEKIISYLSDEIFEADAIDLVSPVADENWLSVRTFSLNK